MKKLVLLGPHFSKPKGSWDPSSQGPCANPDKDLLYPTREGFFV